ncbi:MAG: antibiotic biosynthesis monooxygenase [Rhodothermales bacterium]|nr:antibiotic biosynthesis monooxygenase [Rhodothermales bacterium]
MLIRIVTMDFEPEDLDRFHRQFQKSREKILSFDGCYSVTLLRDIHDSSVLTTYSTWRDEASLNAYRNSEYFGATWRAVKVLFRSPARARSYYEVES